MNLPPASSFVPPSPGAWELERTHTTRPISVLMADVFPQNMMRGFGDGTRAYGVLLDHLEIAIIHRFFYMCPRPVGAPKDAKGTPPKLLFKLLTKLHPELRRRIKRASEVFVERTWRKELDWWDTEVKPGIAAEARDLLSDDLPTLPTTQFVAHLRRAIEFLGRTVYWHHRFNICVMLPTGDFLNHASAWTGIVPEELLRALRGASPVSAGAVNELAALKAGLLADAEGMALLKSNEEPAKILAGLRARPAPLGPAASAYLAVVGFRVLGGYDISDRLGHEHPELLVKIIRAALEPDRAASAGAQEAIQKIRARVPADRQAEFDDLLKEAQLTYRGRDERVFHADAIGAGVARRAVLEAGRRLKEQGRVNDAADLVDCTVDEIASLLETGKGPSAAEIAERVRYRLEAPMDDAPARLGNPPSEPPPSSWLPRDAARLQDAIGTVMNLMFAFRENKKGAGKTLKGFSASPGTYEGKARVINSIGELPQVQQGEILVTRATAPTFNVVLPLLGAIVTERGGALSHAAIVAREYGLPGVVGCAGALEAIRTGDRIRVDGDKGEVVLA
jgi:phosphohistidine swiveling domain-containing protein